MRAYQSTLAMNISENATKYLQLFGKDKDNAIEPAQELRDSQRNPERSSEKHLLMARSSE